jgi:hypothetical protein
MEKDKPPMTEAAQEEFERYISSLVDEGELHFPKGIVFPEVQPPVQQASPGRWASLWRVFLTPAPAYALALLLMYPAYLGVFREPIQVREVVNVTPTPLVTIGTTRVLSLGAAGERGGERTRNITVGPRDGFFTLSFFLAQQPNRRYDVLIRNAKGDVVAKQEGLASQDGLGNFSLVCNRLLFNNGRYVLQISEVNPASSTVEHQDRFTFEVTKLNQ